MRLILIFCGIFLKKFLAEKVLGSIENDNQFLIVLKRREQYFLEDICWPWVLLFQFLVLLMTHSIFLLNQTNFYLNLNTDCSTSLIAKFIELI